MPLNHATSELWCRFQGELLPELVSEVDPLSERHRRFVAGLCRFWRDRPPEDRMALAYSFAAMAVWDLRRRCRAGRPSCKLMDSACDSTEFKEFSRRAGKNAIIDPNPRRNRVLKEALAAEAKAQRAADHFDPKTVRYGEHSTVEHVNARLKDEFGGRHIRVCGHAKVLCNLMFGIVALTVDQLLRLSG